MMLKKVSHEPIILQLKSRQLEYNGLFVGFLIVEALKNALYMRNHIPAPIRDLVRKDLSTITQRDINKHNSFVALFDDLCAEIQIICNNCHVISACLVTGTSSAFSVEGYPP